MENVVARAINHIGLTKVGNRFGIGPSGVQKWRDKGRLPESDLSGRTSYAAGIEELSEGKFPADKLLEETRKAWMQAPRRGRRKRQGR